ncbi:TonB-dependent siderophore receptor [Pseudomonas sp. DWRC2-2]|uniref:TonB-dependent siderophore receptor n=1 Tax=Pseudomonas sp. DWRC2-2 TaxID=2804567 RepID=UPI003CF9DA51
MTDSKERPRYRPTPTLLGLIITGATALASWPGAVLAAERHYSISIESAPLGDALLAIARQSGERISFDPNLVDSFRAKPVQGDLQIEQALQQVLSGTGLTYQRTQNGTYTIVRSQGDSTTTPSEKLLSPLEVWAERNKKGYAADSATAATRTDTSVLELPRSVSTVSRELMSDQQSRSVLDALRNVSGITASEATSGTSPARIQIRGFQVDNAMNDGMMSSGRYGFGTPTIALDRIEVVKGPESIVGGRAAKFGGIVNMVSKRPEAYQQRELQTMIDSNGTTQIGLDITGPITDDKRLRGRLIGMRENGGDTDLGWDGGENNYLSPQLAWVDDDNKVTLGAELQNKTRPFANSVYTFSNRLGHDAATVPHARDDHAEYKNRRYYLDIERYLGGDWQLNLRGQYNEQDGSVSNWSPTPLVGFPGIPPGVPGFPAAGVPAGDAMGASPWKQRMNYRSTTLQGTLSKAFTLGSTVHDVLVGYDYFSGQNTHEIFVPSDPSAVVIVPAGATAIVPSADRYEYDTQLIDAFYKSEETGYFIQDQISIGDSWDVLASARRVSYRTTGDGNAEPLDKWLYGLGVTYEWVPGVSTYASYSQGISNSFGYPTRNGAPLPPVEAEQYEVGAKFSLYDERLIVTTAVFRIQETNVPSADPSDPGFYYTEEGLESTGYEIEARGRVTPKLNVSLAYSDIKLKEMETGETSNGRPRQRINLWGSYQIADRWTLGGGIDSRSHIQSSGIQGRGLRAPGQARLDAMLSYKADSWSAVLGVQNIANRRLYDDYISYESTFVEPERTFTLSTSMKF